VKENDEGSLFSFGVATPAVPTASALEGISEKAAKFLSFSFGPTAPAGTAAVPKENDEAFAVVSGIPSVTNVEVTVGAAAPKENDAAFDAVSDFPSDVVVAPIGGLNPNEDIFCAPSDCTSDALETIGAVNPKEDFKAPSFVPVRPTGSNTLLVEGTSFIVTFSASSNSLSCLSYSRIWYVHAHCC